MGFGRGGALAVGHVGVVVLVVGCVLVEVQDLGGMVVEQVGLEQLLVVVGV